MTTDVTVPTLGESVSEASVIQWFKKVGDAVAKDESLVELETDKVTVEVPSPAAGALAEILVADGTEVEVGTLLCRVEEGIAGAAPASEQELGQDVSAPTPEPTGARPAAPSNDTLSPAVAKMIRENGLDASKIPATGPKGNLTKEDVQNFMKPAPPRWPRRPRRPPRVGRPKPATPRSATGRAVDPRGEGVKISSCARSSRHA